MLKKITFFELAIIGIVTVGCNMPALIQTSIPTYPRYPLIPEPETIIIANTSDVKAKSYRDNKEKLFFDLIHTATDHLKRQLEQRTQASIIINPEATTSRPDSSFTESSDSHIILIKHFDAYFNQTDVVVTKTENGKEREAFYDIVVDIQYEIRSPIAEPFDTLISVRKFHSSRSVLSGLLAAGPSITSNEKDAREGTLRNVDEYLRNFFLGTDSRSRLLYVKKEFEVVGKAIDRLDYARAFEESEKLADSKDKQVAARAYYNCAVLLEKQEDYLKIKPYLLESLRLQNSVEASEMLKDYRFQ
jgi:hypothetical protein